MIATDGRHRQYLIDTNININARLQEARSLADRRRTPSPSEEKSWGEGDGRLRARDA